MITVDNFAIDVALKITPTFKGKASTHPLETGVAIGDTVIQEPDGLTMECIVSNTPSGEMVAIREREVGIPSENAFYRLLALKQTPKLITVITDHRTYSNMVLLEFTPTFDKDTGDALKFTLVFQAMNITTNDRVFVPIAASKDSRGNKPAKKPPDKPADAKADRNSSVLWKLTH